MLFQIFDVLTFWLFSFFCAVARMTMALIVAIFKEIDIYNGFKEQCKRTFQC